MRCLASSATAILTPASAYFIGSVTRVPLKERRDMSRGRAVLQNYSQSYVKRPGGAVAGGGDCFENLMKRQKLKKCGRSAASAPRRDAGWRWRRRRSARETGQVPKLPEKRRGTCRSSPAFR